MKARGVLIISDDEKHLLGDARPTRVKGDYENNTIRDDCKRAVLFAAAPDLLAACESVIGHARRHTDGTAGIDAAFLDDVRAAIAKANLPVPV